MVWVWGEGIRFRVSVWCVGFRVRGLGFEANPKPETLEFGS